MVTLFHWDLPAALQFELGGWAHPDLAPIFADYAEQAFRRLGDRAPLWLTLNEPWVVVDAGYFHGVFPPGVKNQRQGYLVGHNLLRAHAHAVARFRGQGRAGGQISFALNSAFYFPQSDSAADRAAAERAVVNFAGWFADPPHFGDYPALLRERLGNLLPAFSDEDTRLLRRSMDYIALNYYTSDVVRHAPGRGVMEYELATGPDVPRTEMHWPIMPAGQHALLCWLSERYERLPVYITENGAALPDRPDAAGYVHDLDRIAYLRDHFAAAARAARDGVDLRGYFVWSLIDNLEWAAGFAKRFGLIHCDRRTLRRTIKASGEWYARVIATGELDAAPAATPLAAGAGGD
jgi:beta-glucosidase/6-phospho-beta-glucosidase/beta-galactosidase